jgi:truncated hemoglobin YjbI
MREAHAHMKITDFEFNVICELLVKTLQELGVESGIIAEIAPILESVRSDTCNKKSIYERIGGTEAINAAVDIFYGKVLADNRVKVYNKLNLKYRKKKKMRKTFQTFFNFYKINNFSIHHYFFFF